MITIALPALVAVLGLLVYGLSAHKQIGIVMFGWGLLVVVYLLYLLASHSVRLA